MLRGVHHAAGGMDAGDVEVQHGEYVVNATSANKHKSTLDAINDDDNEVSMMDAVFGEKHSTYDTEKDYLNKFSELLSGAVLGRIPGMAIKRGIEGLNKDEGHVRQTAFGPVREDYQGGGKLQPGTGMVSSILGASRTPYDDMATPGTQKTKLDDKDDEGAGTEPSTKEDDVNEVATKEGWHPGKYMQKTGDWMEKNIGYGEGQWAPGKGLKGLPQKAEDWRHQETEMFEGVDYGEGVDDFNNIGTQPVEDVGVDDSTEAQTSYDEEEEVSNYEPYVSQIPVGTGLHGFQPGGLVGSIMGANKKSQPSGNQKSSNKAKSALGDEQTMQTAMKFLPMIFGAPPMQYGGPTKKARYQSGGQTNVTAKNMNKYVANFNPYSQGRGMVKRMPSGSMMSSLRGK